MSPYKNIDIDKWEEKTKQLLYEYPMDMSDMVDVVLEAWESVLNTKIAEKYKVGIDVFPTPQAMGVLLHELIPILITEKFPDTWRRDIDKIDKDIVNIVNPEFSTEIKTSSDLYTIFGNASAGKENSSKKGKKKKSGYMLAINFEKFNPQKPEYKPQILKIRMGWLDQDDWHSQKEKSGQQAKITPKTRDSKLLLIYDKKSGKKSIYYKKHLL